MMLSYNALYTALQSLEGCAHRLLNDHAQRPHAWGVRPHKLHSDCQMFWLPNSQAGSKGWTTGVQERTPIT